MKLSQQTLKILKNFAGINLSIYIKPGNKLSVVSNNKTFLGSYICEETFPTELGIYDISKILSAISIVPDCDLIFNPGYLVLKSKTNSIKFNLCDPALITSPPDNILSDDYLVEFNLSLDDLNLIAKASSSLNLPDLLVYNQDGNVNLKIVDCSNKSSNNYIKELSVKTDIAFNIKFPTEQLRLYPGNYKVKISKRGHAKFINSEIDLFYLIAMDVDSTY